jgi:hypothetical protein
MVERTKLNLKDTMDAMNSIWLEEDHGKLSFPAPVTMLNSDKPMLQSTTVELPPLPPTSYFSRFREEPKKKNNKFISAFKKLSGHETQKPKTRPKISTPYGFSHISHVDGENDTQSKPSIQEAAAPTGVAFNRTLPQQTVTSSLPRSTSQPTSLVSSTFTRASISTTATMTTRGDSTRRTKEPSHAHTTSASSLEQLAKLEKHQISKQCSVDYSSSYKFPMQEDQLDKWGTPPPSNAVRQSWVYEFDSPIERHQFLENVSPTMSTPSKERVETFSNEMDGVFEDSADYQKIQKSIDNFKDLFDLKEAVHSEAESLLPSESEDQSSTDSLLPSPLD